MRVASAGDKCRHVREREPPVSLLAHVLVEHCSESSPATTKHEARASGATEAN